MIAAPRRGASVARVLDRLVVGTLVLAFATHVTAHLWLVLRLARDARPRWRALLALCVPPLAPWWGARAGFGRASAVWLVALAAYVVMLVLART